MKQRSQTQIMGGLEFLVEPIKISITVKAIIIDLKLQYRLHKMTWWAPIEPV